MEIKSSNQSIISSRIIDSKPRRKTYLFVIGALVLVQIISALYFIPNFYASITSDGEKISQLTVEVEDLNRQNQVIDNLDSQKVKRNFNDASLALPTEKKVSGIISSLTALASTSGIVVSQLELTPCKISTRSGALKVNVIRTADCQNVQLENGVNGVNLSMNLVANKNQLQEFIDKLYHVSPMLGVREFGYDSNQRGETASLAILLYFQPSVKMTGGAEKKVSGLTSEEENALKMLTSQLVILP